MTRNRGPHDGHLSARDYGRIFLFSAVIFAATTWWLWAPANSLPNEDMIALAVWAISGILAATCATRWIVGSAAARLKSATPDANRAKAPHPDN